MAGQLLTLVQNCQAKSLSALHSTECSKVHMVLGHDHFLLESASCDDQEKGAHGEKGEGIDPQMREASAAQYDAACDVDVITGGNKVAEDEEEFRHGFARENVAGKENAGEESEEGKLNGFRLRIGFTGDQDADGQRDEKVWQGEESEQEDIAVDGDLKDEAHEGDDRAEFGKADGQVRQQFSKQQA